MPAPRKYTPAQIWGTIATITTLLAGGGAIYSTSPQPPPPDPNHDIKQCLSKIENKLEGMTDSISKLRNAIDTLNLNHRYTREKVDSVSNRVDRLSRAVGQLGWRYGVDLALGKQ